ncbi:CsbD family protein [Ramlibacter sp. Leaf400]|uniref:CsbD family protein n=1 Tax=Ramlibacter sp. Leaf400 TaxID=1736365 RepID=UPI0006FF1835|nr:CsbD family protein [Ramlibacter sp. Leaf400]KQT10663.1 general stress protein CsbD [Ramlibacter sp. Leaf400]
MNEEQVKGKIKEGVGEAQEHLGRVTGNREQEARGHAREQEGKVQKKVGDVEEAVDKVVRKP